ncbi:metal-sulfur cluster assembly factor [Candidatus Gottesmanbacteria bacterium]|nr:metal-sulfur cluster assembly factor [Candidatus Gottesmanbacteria bacterium]
MATKKQIEEVLKHIPDPEIGVSLWDLGLIYGITIDKKTGTVTIRLTLTTIGCPLFSLISEPVKSGVGALEGVKAVEVDLTFDPPWSTEKMSKEAKKQLGFV